MSFPEIPASSVRALTLDAFREMDYYAVQNYHLPVEIMMESAGLQLARLTSSVADPGATVLVGIGPGNNGGGGLVAARRLEAWGYKVHLEIPMKPEHRMLRNQLNRTIAYGAEKEFAASYDIVLDCFFGFAQRLPLPAEVQFLLEKMNRMDAMRISLDIPTGISDSDEAVRFRAHKVLTVAAPKKILLNHMDEYELYIADVGIPVEVYTRNKIDYSQLGFYRDQIVRLV
jgi:NAD(P)H-hydrate epimerase